MHYPPGGYYSPAPMSPVPTGHYSASETRRRSGHTSLEHHPDTNRINAYYSLRNPPPGETYPRGHSRRPSSGLPPARSGGDTRNIDCPIEDWRDNVEAEVDDNAEKGRQTESKPAGMRRRPQDDQRLQKDPAGRRRRLQGETLRDEPKQIQKKPAEDGDNEPRWKRLLQDN